MRQPATHSGKSDSGWKGLYFAGGLAAVIMVVFFRRNCGAELLISQGFSLFDVPEMAPSTAGEWFVLLQKDWFVGLTLFNLFDLINYALLGLVFLALYGALRRINRGAMLAATAFGFVGIAVNFASNQAFSMLALSDRYAEAATEAQRAILLAAGEALLAIDNPGDVYPGAGTLISLFLVLSAGLVISIVILRSADFPKATAYVGIVANGLALGYFIALLVAPSLVWLPPTLSALFRLAWYILISVGLFRLWASINKNSSEENIPETKRG